MNGYQITGRTPADELRDAFKAKTRAGAHMPGVQERVYDFAMAMTWDGRGFSQISNVRIHNEFPFKGTLSFTRIRDGKRVSLRMLKKSWKGVAK